MRRFFQDEHEFRNALNGPVLKDFFNGLNAGKFWFQPLPHDGTGHTVASEICRHVRIYWRENQSLCLAEDCSTCLSYLQHFFVTTPLSSIPCAIQVRSRQGLTLDSIFSQILEQNKLTHYDLQVISRCTVDDDANVVLLSLDQIPTPMAGAG